MNSSKRNLEFILIRNDSANSLANRYLFKAWQYVKRLEIMCKREQVLSEGFLLSKGFRWKLVISP